MFHTMKKTAIIILASLFLLNPLFSQNLSKKELRQMEKEMKKEVEEEEAARTAGLVSIMIKQGRFVLEADRLRDSRGNMTQVSSMINFVVADSIQGVIQVGSNQYVGLNGVGGITVEGPISDYQIRYKEKTKSYFVSYHLLTSSGTYDVQINVSADGRANATISSSWPGRLTYEGYLAPPGISRVYKGNSY